MAEFLRFIRFAYKIILITGALIFVYWFCAIFMVESAKARVCKACEGAIERAEMAAQIAGAHMRVILEDNVKTLERVDTVEQRIWNMLCEEE
jgi:hypothetical protein